MSKHNRILLLTNSERGQANVFLAVSQELLHLDPTIDLHFCSFAPLSTSVSSINSSFHQKANDNTTLAAKLVIEPGHTFNASINTRSRITFHELHGSTWQNALFHREEHRFLEISSLHPTVWNAHLSAAIMPRIACPWTCEELSDLVKQVQAVIQNVQPDLIVLDNLLTPAVTACYKLQTKWIVLSPNTYKEFILAVQPRLQALWKHPPPRSTIPYPVPLYLIPSAILQIPPYLRNIRNPWFLDHANYLMKENEIEYSDWGRLMFPPPGVKVLLPSRPEVDFPFDVVPPHIVSCGPIVVPSAPLKEVDSELAAWLTLLPTVYINLGTHASYKESDAVELAGALRILLEEAQTKGEKLQILWKLKKQGEYQSKGYNSVLAALGPEWADAVRITDWLDAEPIAILETGAVVCSVNHGGANSYFEAVSTGVPQVVLPVWMDTYDFARRVEWLGIGRLGSPKSAPGCSAKELGPILIEVLLGESALRMRSKSKELAHICNAHGGGRLLAAKTILDELSSQEARSEETSGKIPAA